MSSDYYFHKWRNALSELEKNVEIDLELQEIKDPDRKLCSLVEKLSGVLGRYIHIYNEVLECQNQNLQAQKISYIEHVLHTVTKRIVELQRQLSKLEKSNYQFLTHGLVNIKLTTRDVEFQDIPERAIRPPQIQAAIDGVWVTAKELKEKFEEEERQRELEEQNLPTDNTWWDLEGFGNSEQNLGATEKEEELDEEEIQKRKMIKIIKSQEKCRQVTVRVIQGKQKREMWEKLLQGIAKPEKRMELKIRAANIIQKIVRTYFVLKRKKILDCKRDQILGLRMCQRPSDDESIKAREIEVKRMKLKNKYEEEWKIHYEKLKQNYMQEKSDEIREDYRNEIRNWFQKWYKQAWFFYDIPKANQGGSVLILKEEVPSPAEWKDQNQAYVEKFNKNQGKSASQQSQEKMEAKNEAKRLKREEAQKRKAEEILLSKMMKNPQMHPGFKYPPSKEIDMVTEAVENYHKEWDDLDYTESEDVKRKFVPELDKNNAWAEVKSILRPTVDDDMRNELKKLKTALKEEYERLEEPWPTVVIPQKYPKIPKVKRIKTTISDKVVELMVDLALRGFLKEYPKRKFEDFKGEPNFAGDDLRCNLKYAAPYGGETKNVWWDRCRELAHGFNKILLVGPKASGKSLLVHAMASVNDAILFEMVISPQYFADTNADELNELIKTIITCAKAAQPAVIYIKYIHRLFYSKLPPEEPFLDNQLIKKYVKKLTKKFHKTDKITLIGTCIDPWLTRSSQLLKLFPTVLLMPNTTYTTTGLILREWVISNRMIPSDLNVSSLAHVLQGYSFGYLQKTLQDFLTAERITRIAAYGLHPEEIYDFILSDEKETPVEYDKYFKWYSEKTNCGIQERNHLKSQLEFDELSKKYEEKLKKKNKKAISAANSATSSIH